MTRRSGSIRTDLLLLALGAALLYLPFLGARDLWNPNEPTYGQAVVEMAEAGSWTVPTVNGAVFDEKPILYFWLARSTSGLLGGVSELSLRLPSAAAGIAGVLLVYLLVQPYAGRRRARLAAVVWSTIYIVFWSARSAQMDLLLVVCALGAIVAVTRVLDHGFDPWAGWALAGLATGLALLAKGPVGLVVAGLPLAPVLLSAGGRRRLRHPAPLLGGAVCLLVAAPWFLLLWLTGQTDFLHEVLYRQNVTRSLAPWDHQAPWWYYAREFWIDMAPWSIFVPLALGLPAADDDERRLQGLAWFWLLGLVLFFSLMASKRSPYILPVAPAVAILVSAVGERAWSGTLSAARRRVGSMLFLLLGGLLMAGALYAWRAALPAYPLLGGAGPATVLLLFCGGLALWAGVACSRRHPLAAPTALTGFLLALYLLAAGWTLPAADAYKSPRIFAETAAAAAGPDRPLRAYRTWRWRAGYTYYAGRPIQRLTSLEQLRAYWTQPQEVFLVVERGMLDEAREVLGPADPVTERAIGSNHAYLFSNRSPTQPR